MQPWQLLLVLLLLLLLLELRWGVAEQSYGVIAPDIKKSPPAAVAVFKTPDMSF